MKVLVDMNLSPRLATLLSEGGFEAVHWRALGPADTADPDIMEYARRQDFIVVTHDLNFSAILASTQAGKPSVVQIRSDDLTPERLAVALVAGLRQTERELQAGALLTLEPGRMRVRLLPL